MHAEVCLPVTIQIQLAQEDPARNRLFDYAGSHRVTVPQDLSWESNIDRNYSAHGKLVCFHNGPMVLLQYTRGFMAQLWRIFRRATCAAFPLPVECLLLSATFSYSLVRFAIASFVDSSRFYVAGALAK
jgi:hypothetical protein